MPYMGVVCIYARLATELLACYVLKIARQALPDSKSRENNSGAVLSYLRQFMPGSLVHAWL